MIWHVLAGAGVGAAGGAAAGPIGAMLGSVIGGLLGAFAGAERTAGARPPTDDELRRAVCPMYTPNPNRTPTPDELIAMTAALANRPTAEQIAEAGRRGLCPKTTDVQCPTGFHAELLSRNDTRMTCVPDGVEAPLPGGPPNKKPLPDRFPTTVRNCPDGYEFRSYGAVPAVVGAHQGECVRFGADDDFVYGGFSGLQVRSRS